MPDIASLQEDPVTPVASLNITRHETYNRTCPSPSIRLKQTLTILGWRRRTLSSQYSYWIASLVPFTSWASNLSLGSGKLQHFVVKVHPPHVSPLSRPGTRPGIRPVIRDHR